MPTTSGTSTRGAAGGRFATSSTTVVPVAASLPGAGDCRMTVPAGRDDVTRCRRASNPASRIAATASDAVSPTTPGTCELLGVEGVGDAATPSTRRERPDHPCRRPSRRWILRQNLALRSIRLHTPHPDTQALLLEAGAPPPRLPSRSRSVTSALAGSEPSTQAASPGVLDVVGAGRGRPGDRRRESRAQPRVIRTPIVPAIASISPVPALSGSSASRGGGRARSPSRRPSRSWRASNSAEPSPSGSTR